ncbi:uncharacterized protein LOC125206856 [Salvia hispanica]|uniref:uncharacterized protein LOC125206856 n=1 Tax=Salvia hispanica TaxID=49212 RepID=UPI002009770E|nr:uncharacterized protein LOC125206856 [Salvia hispanica]
MEHIDKICAMRASTQESSVRFSCVHGEELDMEASSRHKLLLRGANSQKDGGQCSKGFVKTEANAGQHDPPSEADTTRNIDARQLKFNYVLVMVLIFLIPPLAAFMLFQ